jgi:hypothetical protein
MHRLLSKYKFNSKEQCLEYKNEHKDKKLYCYTKMFSAMGMNFGYKKKNSLFSKKSDTNRIKKSKSKKTNLYKVKQNLKKLISNTKNKSNIVIKDKKIKKFRKKD